MVRNTYTRQTKKHDVYQHRSSVYVRRSVHGAHTKLAIVKKLRQITKSAITPAKTTPKNEEQQYVLPPKQPTPSVILRNDLMAKQRTRVSL